MSCGSRAEAYGWEQLYALVCDLAALEQPTAELCVEVGARHGRRRLDVRFSARGGLVVIDVEPDAALAARCQAELGPPGSIDIVSPPLPTPGRPAARPRWDTKLSHSYCIGTREVVFGLETTTGDTRLVSVAIRY